MTPQDIEEIFTLRTALENLAADLLIERLMEVGLCQA